MNDLTYIELNAILYYADYLSLQEKSIPITDSCKYFFVYGAPINIAYIANTQPIFDENNEYFIKSKDEYSTLREKFGEDGVMSFIDNVCSLRARGKVTGEDMLQVLHRYSQRSERAKALNTYKQYVKNIKYTHLIKGNDERNSRTECTKYVAHTEIFKGDSTKPTIHIGGIEA